MQPPKGIALKRKHLFAYVNSDNVDKISDITW